MLLGLTFPHQFLLTLVFIQEGDVNPFTLQPHSTEYKKILEARKRLPVFSQMDEFMKIVSKIRC